MYGWLPEATDEDGQKTMKAFVPYERVNHWFKHRGFSALDLYDVMNKLSLIHGVCGKWTIMPYLPKSKFSQGMQWALQSSRQEQTNFIIVPLGTENHWTVALIDHKARMVEYWDSRGRVYSFKDPLIQERLQFIIQHLQLYSFGSYRIKSVVTVKHQYLDRNCGLYVIRFMEQRMLGLTSTQVVHDLSYDVESVKSRYHHIRCATVALITAQPKNFQKDQFCSVPQYSKSSWLEQLKLSLRVLLDYVKG